MHVDGDFDTHADEAQRHPALMAELDAGVKAFLTTLERARRIRPGGTRDHVRVRAARCENGSGTDHGAAAAHFVLGVPVRGGRHGEPPSLTKLDPNGNLVVTVDYRDYDAALLEWLDPRPTSKRSSGRTPDAGDLRVAMKADCCLVRAVSST